jgi:DNA-binding MarR family transcriptional regulator
MATTQKLSPETILEALAAHPRLTATKLAEVLGIGQSTAAKHLAAFEAAGTARREPGGHEGGRRMADRWSATAPAADDAALDDADHAASGGSVRSTDRLARGELSTLVQAYLLARPGEDLGPTQIGKALGRSQGAVSNALGRLEVAGNAQLVSASPRRYRIAESR